MEHLEGTLLKRLKRLTPGQTEELLLRLSPVIDMSCVRRGRPVETDVDIISLLKQQGRLELLRQMLDEFDRPGEPLPAGGDLGACPYRGLTPFTAADERFFCGRAAVVEELLDSLQREPRFLALRGPSGSGKTSLIQAGLIPALRRGRIPGSNHWGVVSARPLKNPFDQLAAAGLAGATLVERAQAWRAAHPDCQRLIMVLDPFEELLVTCPPDVRESFVTQLAQVLDSDVPVTVIIAMRDEFYGRLTDQAGPLLEWLNRATVDMPIAIRQEELLAMVREPAEKVGVHFADGLADLIVSEALAADSTGAAGGRVGRTTILPLLEFALTQLWEKQRREDNCLTHEAYREIRGVAGAITQWADRAYYDLDEDQRQLARRILTDLVHVDPEGTRDTRQPGSLADLAEGASHEAVQQVVERLADARLLVTGRDLHSGEETVELIHDSLLRGWGLLQQWLAEDRPFLVWRQQIDPRVSAWVESARDDAARRDTDRLLRGQELADAERWAGEHPSRLRPEARDFVEASADHRERSAARERRRRRAFAAVVAVGLLGSASFAWWGYHQMQEAAEHSRLAMARRLAAEAETLRTEWPNKLTPSVLVALESLRYAPTLEGAQALRRGLALLPRRVCHVEHAQGVMGASFSPDGRLLASWDAGGIISVCDVTTGARVARLSLGGAKELREYDGSYANTRTGVITASFIGGPGSARTFYTGVATAAFSPDGRLLVAGGDNGLVRVWEAESGREVAEMRHEDTIIALAFNPDGSRMAIGSGDGTARVWDTRTWSEVSRKRHESAVCALAFAPDGRRLASVRSEYLGGGVCEYVLRIWDAETGRDLWLGKERLQQGEWVIHFNLLSELRFSPDGRRIASWSAHYWEGMVFDLGFLDFAMRDVSAPKKPLSMRATATALAPDWSREAFATDDTITIWDTVSPSPLITIPNVRGVTALAFSPDGRRIASASADGSARIWDASTGSELARMRQQGTVCGVVYTRDGKYVVSWATDGTARLWDPVTGREIARLPYDSRWKWTSREISTDNSGRLVAVITAGTAIDLWEVPPAYAGYWTVCEDPMRQLAFTSDGRCMGAPRWERGVWEVAPGREVEGPGATDWCQALSPDARWMLVSLSDDDGVIHIVEVREVTTGHIEGSLDLSGRDWLDIFTFSPDGLRIAAGDWRGNVLLWEPATGKKLWWKVHKESVSSLAFSPDGRWLLSGGRDGVATVWDPVTRHMQATFRHDKPVTSVAYSPNGDWIATGSEDGTAQVWDVATRGRLAGIVHERSVTCLAFSPDGRYVASGSADNTVRVWEAATGREVAREVHGGAVTSVAFSPDGRWVGSASDDRTVRVWPWRLEELMAAAHACLTRNLTLEEWNQYVGDEPYHQTCPDLPALGK
jgi:WD40 repeat protein